ncbi:MAG: hypothetical protein JW895_06825 [Thermoleophilaceae bacterium]|nr:hypothetical protein [Thermoleophilaceae bacterium]
MRGFGVTACVALVAATALAFPAAATACNESRRARPPKPTADAPLALGDSVMLGAVDQLAAAGFEVDAKGCRQMAAGVEVLAARRRLPSTVVLALGTNWIVTTAQIRQALRILGPGRVLGLVVPRELASARTQNRRNIRSAGRRWPDRVRVLDWVRYSSGHDSWFAGDGLHLTARGARAFTRLLARALAWTAPAAATSAFTAVGQGVTAESLSAPALPARR